MTAPVAPTAIDRSIARRCRLLLRRQSLRSDAPAASGRLAPKRSATQPAARPRPRPDARICGGEVSLASSSLIVLLHARKWARARDASVIDRTNDGLSGMP